MPIELRIAAAHGVEYAQDGIFDTFGEAMRAGIRLARTLGQHGDDEPDIARAVRLYSGAKRVLTIAIISGDTEDC